MTFNNIDQVAVLNDRALELRGGLDAALQPGDILSFIPAHAGG